jgi:protease I
MERRMSFSAHSVQYPRKACVMLLGLLAIATICMGEQQQPPPVQAPPQQPQQRQPQQPSRVRRTPSAARLKTIQLPEPVTSSAVSLEQALAGQRNMEPPGSQRLEFTKVGQLAWAMQGVRVPTATDASVPTALPADVGAMKVYFVLPDGIYVYGPADHTLQQTGDTDVREALAAAVLNQPGVPAGGCQIILAGSARDLATRYGTRARTVMLLQAGRMAQSLQLQAAALGLALVSIDSVEGNSIRRVVPLPRSLEPLYVALVGYPASQAPQPGTTQSPTLQTAKVALMVVPPQGFQDAEFAETKRALELAGVQVFVASTRLGVLTGMLGGTTQADLLLNQTNVDNFNAVVFIGGTGALDYFSNSIALNLARQAFSRRKVLAAIGTAPTILANAGVLRGATSTAYLSEKDRLIQGGANYTGNPVEKDGLVVTATGPLAASTFARAILDGLAEGG